MLPHLQHCAYRDGTHPSDQHHNKPYGKNDAKSNSVINLIKVPDYCCKGLHVSGYDWMWWYDFSYILFKDAEGKCVISLSYRLGKTE